MNEAQKAWRCSPSFSIAELSGRAEKPCPRELKRVFGLQHMMECINYTIPHWRVRKRWELHFLPEHVWDSDGHPISETGTGHWHRNLYRALYRVVLCGAVLRVYNELLFSAVEIHAYIALAMNIEKGNYDFSF